MAKKCGFIFHFELIDEYEINHSYSTMLFDGTKKEAINYAIDCLNRRDDIFLIQKEFRTEKYLEKLEEEKDYIQKELNKFYMKNDHHIIDPAKEKDFYEFICNNPFFDCLY